MANDPYAEYVITLRGKSGEVLYFVGRSTDLDEEIWNASPRLARKFRNPNAALFEAQFLKRYADIVEYPDAP